MPDNTIYFNHQSQSGTYFREEETRPLVKTVYRAKKVTFRRPQYQPVKDSRSLSPWRSFDIIHEPKEVKTVPRKILKQRHDQTLNAQREHEKAVKVRPRTQRSPQRKVDEFDEPFRHMFMDQLYCTSAIKAMREAVAIAKIKVNKEPLSEIYAPHNPVTIEPLLEPYVCPEWCADADDWERQQMMDSAEINREYWLKPPISPVYKPTPIPKTLKKMRRR